MVELQGAPAEKVAQLKTFVDRDFADYIVVTISIDGSDKKLMAPAMQVLANADASAIERFDSVLNIFGKPQRELLDDEIQALIDERQEARHRRDFARADEIRDVLAERGITLEDTKDGVRWKTR